MNMNEIRRTYTYQQRFTSIEVPVFSLISLFFIASWLPLMMSVLLNNRILGSALQLGLFFGITAAASILLILFLKKEMQKNLYAITDFALIYRTPGKMLTIPFANVLSLTYNKGLIAGKSVKISTASTTITIPFIINGIHDLLQDIQQGIISNGAIAALDKNTTNTVTLQARFQEQAYKRGFTLFYHLVSLTIIFTSLNFLFALRYWEFGIYASLKWSIIAFFIPNLTYLTSELLINKDTAKFKEEFHDDIYNNAVKVNYLTAIFILLLLFLTTGLIFRNLY
jgi:hypothetical protein